jgi:predicted nuclease of predicted toxin-antitoxin system
VARFLIDESLPRAVTRELVAAGHDVIDARDVGLRGTPDAAVQARAAAEGRIVVSGDVDFANALRFAPGSHPGIIVLRVPNAWAPADRARRVVAVLDEILLSRVTGAIVIVDAIRVRVLAPPRG